MHPTLLLTEGSELRGLAPRSDRRPGAGIRAGAMSMTTCPHCRKDGFNVWSRNPGVGISVQCKLCGQASVALPLVNGVWAILDQAALLVTGFWSTGHYAESYARLGAGTWAARAQLWWPLIAGTLLYLAAEWARAALVPLRPAEPADAMTSRAYFLCFVASTVAVVCGIGVYAALKFSA